MKRKDPNDYPLGWDAERVSEVAEYYDHQSDDEAAAEHEAALSRSGVLQHIARSRRDIEEGRTLSSDEVERRIARLFPSD
jgi:hypothetical protein